MRQQITKMTDPFSLRTAQEFLSRVLVRLSALKPQLQLGEKRMINLKASPKGEAFPEGDIKVAGLFLYIAARSVIKWTTFTIEAMTCKAVVISQSDNGRKLLLYIQKTELYLARDFRFFHRLCHNFARTICSNRFESGKSTG